MGKIIGINGFMGSGKDTVGSLIQQYQPDKWEVKKFAFKLKQIASILTGIPIEKFEDQEFKKTLLGEDWEQYVISWNKGDNGPGKAAFKKEEELKTFIDHYFDATYEEVLNAGQIQHQKLTVRDFLQRLGTDAIRDNLHTNTWVNALFADYNKNRAGYAPGNYMCTCGNCQQQFTGDKRAVRCEKCSVIESNWLVTDTRFYNEAQAIKERGGLVIRIIRGEENYENKHISETALKGYPFDYVIYNNGDLKELETEVIKFVNKFNL